MIIILTRPDLKNNDHCPLSDIDIRTAQDCLGAKMTAEAERIEFHDYNGFIRVIKDRHLDRPPGFLPKTHDNGYGEADRIHIVGYRKEANWYAAETTPNKPTGKVVDVGFSETAPVATRKLVIDAQPVVAGPTTKKK